MRLFFCIKCGLVFFRDQERTGTCTTCGQDLREVRLRVTIPVHANPSAFYTREGVRE